MPGTALAKGLWNRLVQPYRQGSPSRYGAAFGAAIVNSATLLYLMLRLEPLTTRPLGLLGCYTYYVDLNITNRLAAVALATLWALLAFHIFAAFLERMGPDEPRARGALGYALLPTAIWFLAIAFLHKRNIIPVFFILSCGLCWAVVIYYLGGFRPAASGRWKRLRAFRGILDAVFRSAARGWHHLSGESPLRTAAAVGAAAVSASAAVSLTSLLVLPSNRPLAWFSAFQSRPGLGLALGAAMAALFLMVAVATFKVFSRRLAGLGPHEPEALGALGYVLLPSLLGVMVFFSKRPDQVAPFWLFLSCGLSWLVLAYYPLAIRRTGSGKSVNLLLLSIVLAFFAAPALLTAGRPLIFLIEGERALETLAALRSFFAKIQWLFPAAVVLAGLAISDIKQTARYLFFPAQVLLLLLMVVIVPGPFQADGRTWTFYPMAPTFLYIVLPLFLLGLGDCIYRCFLARNKSFMSPFPWLALLLLMFFSRAPWPGYSNLYEFGSRFAGFWVSKQGWGSLFQDAYITYGLWDYYAYDLGWFFSGQHTAAMAYSGGYWLLLLLFSGQFLALCAILPVGAAFFICLWVGVGSHTPTIIFFALLFIPGLLKRPAVWIMVWALLGGLAPFAKIPQGTMCVVASLPAFVWQAVALYKSNRKHFWWVGGLLSVWALMFMVGPFSGYFWGLIRIFTETAKVNSPWAANFWELKGKTFGAAVLGNAVIVAPLMALVAAVFIVRSDQRREAPLAAFMLFSLVLLYAYSGISYGYSRTDSRPYTRQFQVLLTVLPMILVVLANRVRTRTVWLACLIVAACFMTLQPRGLPIPGNVLAQASQPHGLAAPNKIEDAGRLGLPHIGAGLFPPGYLEEERLLKQALDRFLAPGETFFDLTMDGVHYYDSQRRPVTEYPVYYVYPGDPPQYRAIGELRRHQVRVSLLDPDSFDFSPSSLRAPYLYRYGLLQGLPVEISPKKTLLMPPEYLARAGLKVPDRSRALELLDKQFPLNNLYFEPLVWGRGYPKSIPELSLVRTLQQPTAGAPSHPGEFRYPLDPPLNGTQAGLLVLEVEAQPDQLAGLSVQWQDNSQPDPRNRLEFMAGRGTLIVPLDSSPRWLLGRAIDSLTLRREVIAPQLRGEIWDRLSFRPVNLELKNIGGGHRDESGNIVPEASDMSLDYAVPEALQGRDILVRFKPDFQGQVEKARIYFKTPGGYDDEPSEEQPAWSGQNTIMFQISSLPAGSSEIRISLSQVQGNFTVKEIKAKPMAPTDRPPTLTISRAELRQRPMVHELGLDSLGPWAELD